MNDHDFGNWSYPEYVAAVELYRQLIGDLQDTRSSQAESAPTTDAMSWSPRWGERYSDAPMRSHP